MKFRTETEPIKSGIVLNPEQPIMLAGSCFADNMAERLRRCMWRAERPLGTLYNPASIEKALRLTALGDDEGCTKKFRDSLLHVQDAAVYKSWFFDSRMSGATPEELSDKFMQLRNNVRSLLKESSVLFVTFGTAWVYCLSAAAEDGIVGNCHKQPEKLFRRVRMETATIDNIWNALIRDMRQSYPALNFVFTVSPVRHVRDGLHGNNLSKATLLLAAEEICSVNEDCIYFPAYEMMVDDLRDYRFYASDLVHPGEQGIEYIWERFKDTFMDAKAIEAVRRGEKEYKKLHHRQIVQP